jgi:hypothetical protein
MVALLVTVGVAVVVDMVLLVDLARLGKVMGAGQAQLRVHILAVAVAVLVQLEQIVQTPALLEMVVTVFSLL